MWSRLTVNGHGRNTALKGTTKSRYAPRPLPTIAHFLPIRYLLLEGEPIAYSGRDQHGATVEGTLNEVEIPIE